MKHIDDNWEQDSVFLTNKPSLNVVCLVDQGYNYIETALRFRQGAIHSVFITSTRTGGSGIASSLGMFIFLFAKKTHREENQRGQE